MMAQLIDWSYNMRKLLEEEGFAESRIWDLTNAAERLHAACCPLDSHNLELFTQRYGGPLGIFKFMADYSDPQNGTRTIGPVKIGESCAADAEDWWLVNG